jgi:hypothetical protein
MGGREREQKRGGEAKSGMRERRQLCLGLTHHVLRLPPFLLALLCLFCVSLSSPPTHERARRRRAEATAYLCGTSIET